MTLKDVKGKYKINIGGKKFQFSELPTNVQKDLKLRIAEKCKVYAQGLEGILPGIKINGKQVTKDNIHEFEKKSMPKKKPVPNKSLKQTMKENMTVKELKAEAKKLKIKGVWKMKEDELIDVLVKAGYE